MDIKIGDTISNGKVKGTIKKITVHPIHGNIYCTWTKTGNACIKESEIIDAVRITKNG